MSRIKAKKQSQFKNQGEADAFLERHIEQRLKTRTLEKIQHPDGSYSVGPLPPLEQRSAEQLEDLRRLGIEHVVARLEDRDPMTEAGLHLGFYDSLPLPQPRRATAEETQSAHLQRAEVHGRVEERQYTDFVSRIVNVAARKVFKQVDSAEVRAAIEFLVRPEHGLMILDYKAMAARDRVVDAGGTQQEVMRVIVAATDSAGFDLDAIQGLERKLRSSSGQLEMMALRILRCMKEHGGPVVFIDDPSGQPKS